MSIPIIPTWEGPKLSLYRSAMRQKKEREYSDRVLFRRYLKHLAPFKRNIIMIAVFVIFQAICELISPLLVGFVTNEFDSDSPRIILAMVAGISYLLIQKYIFHYVFDSRELEIIIYILIIQQLILNISTAFTNIFAAKLEIAKGQIPKVTKRFIVMLPFGTHEEGVS